MIRDLFRTLWPFVFEMFFEDDEVRSKLKNRKFVFKWFIITAVVLAVVGGGFRLTITLLYETFDRYRVVTTDYLELQEGYDTVMGERRDLRRELSVCQHRLEDKGEEIADLETYITQRQDAWEERVERLERDLEDCSPQPENGSSILDRLRR